MKHSLTEETAPPSPAPVYAIDQATLDLLAAWRSQDATDDPKELRAAEQELARFKKAMNESRVAAGEPLLYP